MKKLISFFLCLLILAQMLPILAAATEPVPTAEPQQETMPPMPQDAPLGLVTILNGCRTMDAQVPMGGDSRMLDTAVSAFVYERNTGSLIYAYNPDLKMQPGTFTKLVAAIVAIVLFNNKLSASARITAIAP